MNQEAVVDRVFLRLQAIYGQRFADMWATADDETMKRAWGSRLSHFSLPTIQGALEQCEVSVKRPPTLPEFVELCRASAGAVARPVLPAPPPVLTPSPAALRVCAEFPKPAVLGQGDVLWWARRIVRLDELGESPGSYPVSIARKLIAERDGGASAG